MATSKLGMARGLSRVEREQLFSRTRHRHAGREPLIPRANRSRPLPLSHAQERLWFLTQMEGVSGAYHIPLGLRLRGLLDQLALRRALDRLVSRHEILRTRFVFSDGTPVQRISSPGLGVSWCVEDLRGRKDVEHEVENIKRREVTTPFDLQHGPLFRARLLVVGDEEYLLLLTMHHIVSDGWSLRVLMRELSALYGAFRVGGEDPLPPLGVQYADYAVWQRGWLAGELLEEQSRFWEETLAGAPTLLALPTDRPRPAQQDHRGGSVPLILDEPTSRSLRSLSQRHGMTLYMTVLAGWAALLGRLAGEDDVVVGSAVANRTRREIEPLVGFFVNTLAQRIDLSGNPTVGDCLERVKTRVLEAQEHQDLPFEHVVELVKPVRSMSHTPVFQAMFGWEGVGQDGGAGHFALPGLDVAVEAVDYRIAKCDLTLSLGARNGQIRGGIEYATALFDRETIDRYRGYLETLLTAMAADESLPLHGIDVLGEAERHRLVVEWNDTGVDLATAGRLELDFEKQVGKSPAAPAVEFEGETLSYEELDARANRLAHYLIDLGVTRDARVALCVERSAEMVVGLLAILKAGGAYVPLDPSLPSERLAYMVGDSSPVAVLTHSAVGAEVRAHLVEVQQELGIPRVELDAESRKWAERPSSSPRVVGRCPQDLAYVIYTSGSTGTPKGVMVEHSSVCNRIAWMQDAYDLELDDVVLQKTPFGFDVSVWEFFWPLLTGAKLLLARPGGHVDPTYLVGVIQERRVTTLHFVPSMLTPFLAHGSVGACTSLRRVVCSGETLLASQVMDFQSRLPRALLYNLYGPTEATVDVSAWACGSVEKSQPVPIGRPIANTRIYILDSTGRPVPRGSTGELHVGGAQVARGYLNRPQLTHERFSKDPFAGNASARMYRTGDLGRFRADGNIEFLGRNDHQVKLRGFRIELGEIESCLSEHASVREAAVLLREDRPGDKRLVAYCTTGEGHQFRADVLRAHLGRTLPDYMLPAAYVELAALPRTPNGKLDRKLLPAPGGDARARRAHLPPVGEVETKLAELWCEVLGV